MPYHYGRSRHPIQPFISKLPPVILIVITDTPVGIRGSGPAGVIAIDVPLTDLPGGIRDFGPEGDIAVGVTVTGDSPQGVRASGPDGSLSNDLVVTDLSGTIRYEGAADGAVILGVATTDTPSASRFSGPDGSVQTDTAGTFTLTGDTPSAGRYLGPDGAIALGIVLSDLPAGYRSGGSNGLLTVDVILTDSPTGTRSYGPDGIATPLLGSTPGGFRVYGPDGSTAIDLLIRADQPSASRLAGPSGLVDVGVGADVIIYDSTTSGLYPSPDLYPSSDLYPQATSIPDARQIELSGPDGIVLLAFLPSKPPYVPTAPLVAPDYSVWLADTVTGRMLWSLPMETMSWTITLNDIGTIRTTLVAEDAWDALSDQNERDPRVLLREVLSGTWRFCLVVKWGNNVVWAGPYLSFSRNNTPSSNTPPNAVELNGAEIQKILNRRVLVAPGATVPGDPSANTVMGPNVNKRYIAAALVNQAMIGTGRSLPINVTFDNTPGIEYRTYYGYDLAYYWDKLRDLMSEVDGPEVRFDPKITQGSDANYLSWDMQIGAPHLGRGTTSWTFDSDVNSVVGLDSDGSNIALQVWSAGSGQSQDKLIISSADTTQLSFGWPLLEGVDNNHTSEINYNVLLADNAAQLAAWKKPVTAFKLTVPADVDPVVGSYRVGEDFSVDIRQDPIIPDGLYSRRIAGLAGSEKPWVTITDTDPLAVGAT